jgi:hypothetical protein
VPFLTQADLNLLHDIKVKGQSKLQLQLTVLNLLDQDTVPSQSGVAYRDALVIPGATPQAAFFQSGGFDTAAIQASRLPASGRPGPLYGLANGYQSARSVRAAAKFSF